MSDSKGVAAATVAETREPGSYILTGKQEHCTMEKEPSSSSVSRLIFFLS